MRVSVKVIPSAKVEQIQMSLEGSLKVWLKAKPVDGRANQALTKLLAKHYSVKKGQVRIVQGLTTRQKLIEVDL